MPHIHHFIDLHAHLDGSIRPSIALQLAKEQGIHLPTEDTKELEKLLSVSEDCESLNDFLKCFALPLTLLQTQESIKRAIELILEDMQKDHVIYAELRFAPQLHTQNGCSQEDIILSAIEAIQHAAIPCNLILCLMRGEGNEKENEETLQLAKKYLVEDHGVVAIDLAGAEALYPTENYELLFKKAKDLAIPFTIHAGEASGEESVEKAIQFGAKRIGHGIRIPRHSSLLSLLKEKEIVLELCPTSNRQTKAIDSMENYPLINYLNLGLKVTLNTDDMAIENTTLSHEFEIVENLFSLTKEQELTLLNNAIEGAFCSQETKKQLKNIIQKEENL